MAIQTRWQPLAGIAPRGPRYTGGRIPEPGQLIACWDRQPYRVIEVDDVAPANWTEKTTAAWERAGSPDPTTWNGRERRALAEPARDANPNGKDRVGIRLCPWSMYPEQWWPLDDPYPVCVDCGLLWPCPCYDRNREAEAGNAELDRLTKILPGCCWACGEPVTGRHHSILFDGENLLLPGGGPVVFHTSKSRKAHRGTCRGLAIEYESRWVAAGPGRAVRLTCPGRLWRHFDWSECSQGDRCTGVDSDHADFQHCTTGVLAADGSPVRPATSCGAQGCRGGA